MSNVLCDPRAETVLARLRDLETQQSPEMRRYYDAKRRAGSGPTNPGSADDMSFVRDKLVALDPEKCDLCYLLCRSLRATRVVEFGTSFGVSTIYLAAAVRDNMRDFGGEGVVIGTEIEPSKAAIAQQNLSDAGLSDFVEIRIGDARQTLKDAGGPVDFLLLDSWIPLVRPVIDVVAPQLRAGAVVLCDNVELFEQDYRDYTSLVRDPRNGFRSVLLSHQGGIELSVKLS
ncbi:class I SAM-dependent methyltransferase [Bradyrhizobium sp. SK17]|uniref:O-methyltransferase n=1 Tax=Bradyrhizobium sp. SK17 TaxID=2057741 RepID=UPI000C310279|nr:class I SAM-dependent methyltransferase [Bradyrhizobium sp. SK17]AUC95372.1 methyltransferase [Bradyrhizobium sp. SK17]